MTLEITKNQSTNKSYWIKFKEDTGKILGISKGKPSNINPGICVVESKHEDLSLLVRGNANIKDYFVQENALTEEWVFVKKSKDLELQPVRKKFEQISYSNNIEENDIYITIYKQSMKAIIAINSKRVLKSKNLSTINNVVSNEYSLLNLFVCKNKDPDSLISIIEVDTKSLIANKKIIVDLPQSILQYTDIEDASIFVLPVFESYGINYVNELVETPELIGQNKIINSNVYGKKSTLNIYTVNDNVIEIQHNIEESQFNLFGSRNTMKFLICNQYYDKLVGGFEISVNDLLSANTREILLNFKVPKVPLFLYKNNNISVSYNGDKHEQYD